jgi:hypothetical protein
MMESTKRDNDTICVKQRRAFVLWQFVRWWCDTNISGRIKVSSYHVAISATGSVFVGGSHIISCRDSLLSIWFMRVTGRLQSCRDSLLSFLHFIHHWRLKKRHISTPGSVFCISFRIKGYKIGTSWHPILLHLFCRDSCRSVITSS